MGAGCGVGAGGSVCNRRLARNFWEFVDSEHRRPVWLILLKKQRAIPVLPAGSIIYQGNPSIFAQRIPMTVRHWSSGHPDFYPPPLDTRVIKGGPYLVWIPSALINY